MNGQKRIVVAERGDGTQYAIGPVYTAKTVEVVQEMVAAHGDRPVGPLELLSLGEYEQTGGAR